MKEQQKVTNLVCLQIFQKRNSQLKENSKIAYSKVRQCKNVGFKMVAWQNYSNCTFYTVRYDCYVFGILQGNSSGSNPGAFEPQSRGDELGCRPGDHLCRLSRLPPTQGLPRYSGQCV